MLWGFHFLPPKAKENEFSPVEDLSVTGHQTAINWECTLCEETDKTGTVKNGISNI